MGKPSDCKSSALRLKNQLEAARQSRPKGLEPDEVTWRREGRSKEELFEAYANYPHLQ